MKELSWKSESSGMLKWLCSKTNFTPGELLYRKRSQVRAKQAAHFNLYCKFHLYHSKTDLLNFQNTKLSNKNKQTNKTFVFTDIQVESNYASPFTEKKKKKKSTTTKQQSWGLPIWSI